MHRPKAQSTACLGTLKPVKRDIKQIYPPHDTTCLKITPLTTNRSIQRMIQSKYGKLKAYNI
jgi:hypothetical protein